VLKICSSQMKYNYLVPHHPMYCGTTFDDCSFTYEQKCSAKRWEQNDGEEPYFEGKDEKRLFRYPFSAHRRSRSSDEEIKEIFTKKSADESHLVGDVGSGKKLSPHMPCIPL